MKISLNWLKDYLEIDLSPEQIGDILTEIGLEVEGMEEVENIPGGLKGVVVGEVVECGRHPNADKLSLTRVNIGKNDHLSIVCGAPNVAKGQRVLVATVGTSLYPLGSEQPLVMEKTKIRGELSEGMICAEDELGIGTSHDGIMVLPAATPVGMAAAEYFSLKTDVVYEIGLTPNRSDATNHLGVAKDLAAALKINYNHTGEVRLPDLSNFKIDHYKRPVKVEVKNPEAAPRYAGLSLSNIQVGESPDWLKERLMAVDVRPINNVVDITNFVLHEYGQPLHAFDLDKISGEHIIVQTLPKGSKFVTLDEVERTLLEEDLMICNGKSEGLCIGGVFGGVNSGVTERTSSIFLESAHFNAKSIRRTSMKHNLRTDAAKVFEKGSDPEVAIPALKRAALLMQELAGAEIASDIIDLYPKPVEKLQVELTYESINRLIGTEIPVAEVHHILEALEMEVLKKNKRAFTVAVPTNKADVTRPADIIEEILRIYGFNRVPMPAKTTIGLNVAPVPDPVVVRNTIGDLLAANGFNEMMAVSLSQSGYYREMDAGIDEAELVYVNNTSNVQLDIMRPDMLFSGLEVVLHNQNRQQKRLKLFEFGRTYRMKGDELEEKEHLSLFLYGDRTEESWITPSRPVDYYSLKAEVERILERFGIVNYQVSEVEDPGLLFGLKLHRGPQALVEFGKVQPDLVKSMDIRGEVFFALFHWENLLGSLKKQKVSYEEVSRFPGTRRDLAMIIENSTNFDDIAAIARKLGKPLIRAVNLFDVYENEEQLGKNKRSYAVSFQFEHPEKTLKDKEVDKVIQKLTQAFEKQLGASIRK